MQNKTLIAAAKKILKKLLPQCTPGEQLMFKRMYCHKNLEASPEEAIDQMNPEKMDWAITQCESTIEKRKNDGTEGSHSQTT